MNKNDKRIIADFLHILTKRTNKSTIKLSRDYRVVVISKSFKTNPATITEFFFFLIYIENTQLVLQETSLHSEIPSITRQHDRLMRNLIGLRLHEGKV